MKTINNSKHSFQNKTLNEPAYVEIHQSHGKMIGLVFHVGEFVLPLLRSRPHQRIYNRIDSNFLRPWVMGRVTCRKNILLENPGRPGIFLNNLAAAGNHSNDDLLSAALWLDNEHLDFSEFKSGEKRGYFYKEIAVTAPPVLVQSYQTDSLKVTMKIMLSADGPLQRATLEVAGKNSIEPDYCLLSMFPKGVTDYYAHDYQGRPLTGTLEHPSDSDQKTEVAIAQARWLALYNHRSQFGTLVYSPGFATAKLKHLLVTDRGQDFKLYHVAGNYKSFTGLRASAESTRPTLRPGHPKSITLLARPIEAEPGEWKQEAENVMRKT